MSAYIMQENDFGRGKSIIAFPNNYVIVDLETTGLYPSNDEIIEVAAVKYENGVEVGTFQELIQPHSYPAEYDEEYTQYEKAFHDACTKSFEARRENNTELAEKYERENLSYWIKMEQKEKELPQRYVSDFIIELTGITNEMLETARTEKEVIPEFLDFIGDNVVFGYNVNFDIRFLVESANWTLSRAFKNDCVDVLRIARKTLKHMQSHTLALVSDELNVHYDGAHRALRDCYITKQVLEILKEKAVEQYGSLDCLIAQFKHNSKNYTQKIVCTATEFNEDGPLYQKCVAFTGALEKFTRAEAMQELVNVGGIAENGVTKKTNYLVVGDMDYLKNNNGYKSNKLQKAENNRLKGQDINIIPEKLFIQLLKESYSSSNEDTTL